MSNSPKRSTKTKKKSLTTNERSAGVIAFHRDPSSNEPHFLLLDYGRHWDYPKGHLETGETDEQAARRELREETGISSASFIPNFSRQIVYFFRHPRRGLIRKTVVFFLAEISEREITLSHEHVGHEFLPLEAALARVTFASSKQVLREAATHLKALADAV